MLCSGCRPSHFFTRGLTLVRKFVVFHFCARAWRFNRAHCLAVMAEVAGALPTTRTVRPASSKRVNPPISRAFAPGRFSGGQCLKSCVQLHKRRVQLHTGILSEVLSD